MCLRYAGLCYTNLDSESWTKISPSGLPKLVNPLREFLMVPEQRLCALNFLLSFRKTGYTPRMVETTSITEDKLSNLFEKGIQGTYFTQSCKIRHTISSDKSYRRVWREVLEEAFPAKSRDKRILNLRKSSDVLHTSTKKGPNGKCIPSAALDFLALSKESINMDLFFNIKRLAYLTRNKSLVKLINGFNKDEVLNKEVYNSWTNASNKLMTSRLSIKKDENWGKKRLFAIGDYFSQSSLIGIHDFMFSWLHQQPGDGTFCQDHVADIVREWTGDEEITGVDSADLSSATDHIPVKLLYEIVLQMFGKDIAESWFVIMTDREFHVPWDEEIKIRYNTGQPLGLLTSWAAMSIWHHLIYRMSHRLAGIEYQVPRKGRSKSDIKPGYVVLGDDSSNVSSEVTTFYNNIVVEHCDIGVSKKKGFSPGQIDQRRIRKLNLNKHYNKTAELAKRVFCNGSEVTTVPSTIIVHGLQTPNEYCQALLEVRRRISPTQELLGDLSMSLLSLHNNKRAAFEQSTFPLWPVLPKELTKPTLEILGRDNAVVFSDEYLALLELDIHSIEEMTKISLHGRITQSLNDSFVHLMEKFQKLDEGTLSKWQNTGLHLESMHTLWGLVLIQYHTRLHKAEMQLRTVIEKRLASRLTNVISYPELAALSARLKTIMDLDDLIEDRYRETISPDQEVSKLIGTVTNMSLKPLPLMYISASLSLFDQTLPLCVTHLR
jgi:hypothetical protein